MNVPIAELKPIKLDILDLNKLDQIEDDWSLHDYLDSYQSGHMIWAYKHEQVLLAYVVTQCIHPEIEILNVYVPIHYRQLGLAKKLLSTLIAQFKPEGIDTILLEVRRSNTIAYRLYQSLGFVDVGCRRNYYATDTGFEDAILMTCYLDNAHSH